jgi:predicted DNA-binding protein YlxM (UPF0122 family)
MVDNSVRLSIPEIASLFGCPEQAVIDLIERRSQQPINQSFYSIGELAKRWRCSRGTVYNRLRAVGAKVLSFSPSGKKGKKAVSAMVVTEIEAQNTKRLC